MVFIITAWVSVGVLSINLPDLMGIFWYIKQNNKLPSSFCETHSGYKKKNGVLQSIIRDTLPVCTRRWGLITIVIRNMKTELSEYATGRLWASAEEKTLCPVLL